MDSPGSITRSINDLRSEDPAVRDAAARAIWQRYFRKLLGLARNHLKQRIRRRMDEEDVLQSMFKSFFFRQQQGQFGSALTDRDSLWRLLVTITLRKARNAANHHRRGKRDLNREGPATGAIGDDGDFSVWDLEQLESAGPTPETAAILTETLERRIAALGDLTLREIALRKLEGYTNLEIARQRGCTPRTVERKVERIKAKFQEYEEDTRETRPEGRTS
jgi:RNA polymerase sigma factor (sigma-70 family)